MNSPTLRSISHLRNQKLLKGGKRRAVCHGTAIAVRTPYSSKELRRLATRVKNAGQARRPLAITALLDGASRQEAAMVGGMGCQTLRDWATSLRRARWQAEQEAHGSSRPFGVGRADTMSVARIERGENAGYFQGQFPAFCFCSMRAAARQGPRRLRVRASNFMVESRNGGGDWQQRGHTSVTERTPTRGGPARSCY